MERDDLIDNWLGQETSAEEREELERIIRFTETMDTPSNTSKTQAWDNLMTKIKEAPATDETVLIPEVSKQHTNRWLAWVASAAAILLVGYFTLFNNPSNSGSVSFEAGAAEMISHTLPDQSKITLNAGSLIEFNEADWANNREILLTGEAFFEVTPGSKFTVSTENGAVTVLGTSFNVYDRDGSLQVHCFTGKVEVASQNEKVLLTPNKRAAIDRQTGRLTVEEFNPQKTATWRIGEFYFDAVALTEVIEELERQFNIQIEVTGDVSDRFYSGFFSTESLTEALQLVFVPMGLSTAVNGKTVTVE